MNEKTTPYRGVYYDVSLATYLAWDAFSRSMTLPTLRSARHLHHYQVQEKALTDSLILGSLVDALTISPAELDNFEELPETYINTKGQEMPFNLRSKSCKQAYDAIIADGVTPIKAEQMAEAERIVSGIRSNPAASQLIDSGKKQVSLVWEDEDTGVLCKGRLDLVDNEYITDIKTTRDATKDAFSRAIYQFGYHIQAAFYLDGWARLNKQSLGYKIIAAENSAPYCTAVYTLGEPSIESGQAQYKAALARYADILANDPDFQAGYSAIAEPIDIPVWAVTKILDQGEL